MLEHLLDVEIGYEEADVVAFHGFSPQNKEMLRALHHEPHELLAQNLLDLIGLLHRNADADGVNGSFDQDLFFFIPTHNHWSQQQFFAARHFDFRLVMSFYDLGVEIFKAHGSG